MARQMKINVRKAIALYEAGNSCGEIGVILAQEMGRSTRFLGPSVANAIRPFMDKFASRRNQLADGSAAERRPTAPVRQAQPLQNAELGGRKRAGEGRKLFSH